MDEVKTAICVGVMEITRVNITCPHCDLNIEAPYEEFVKDFGEPFTDDQAGRMVICPKCREYYQLGEFEVQE